MDVHQRPLHLSLQSTLFTLLITSLLASSNSWFSNAKSISTLNQENKVTLELYYESLCPYCERFMVNHLYKLFETDLITITDLKLIPYGNAKVSNNETIICQRKDSKTQEWVGLNSWSSNAAFIAEHLAHSFDAGIIDISDVNLFPWGNANRQTNDTVTCQHGEYECLLNTVEACAIDVWPDVNEHFPFVYCVENLVYQGEYLQWETCFKTLGLNDKPIADCVESEKGLQLNLKYAAETNALQPPHKYVPWVVVDGQPLYDDYENFLEYICKAYQGTSTPAVCENSVTMLKMPKWKLSHPGCYKEAM